MHRQTSTLILAMAAALAAGACSDSVSPTGPTAPDQVSQSRVKFPEVRSSVRWNRLAISLFRARGGNAGRANAYVSLGQYRAVLAAKDGKEDRMHPSPTAAAAGASVVLLKQFYPLDAATIDAELAAQRAETPWSDEKNKDFAAGEAIGRAVGADVLAFAAADHFGATDPGLPPTTPGSWKSSGAPIARGGYGARPFFLRSNNELILPPPPAFGSADYLAALAEVRSISDHRTPEQLAISQKWAPFAGVVYNTVASDLIIKYRKTEIEAARIYAYGNAAAFDAIIACFENKFTYWFIRPPQADPLITTPIGLPNHPSYPSAHSCESGAWMTVLAKAFPKERAMLIALAQEAADSRLFAGIHYRFDNVQGVALGRATAQLALTRGFSDQ
jgi:membrane-associated phospholipid phosphatase